MLSLFVGNFLEMLYVCLILFISIQSYLCLVSHYLRQHVWPYSVFITSMGVTSSYPSGFPSRTCGQTNVHFHGFGCHGHCCWDCEQIRFTCLIMKTGFQYQRKECAIRRNCGHAPSFLLTIINCQLYKRYHHYFCAPRQTTQCCTELFMLTKVRLQFCGCL